LIELSLGYWDAPADRATRDARLLFLTLFDWDQLHYRNNQYVLVQIDLWPSHPETVGKRALIESIHVRFTKASGAEASSVMGYVTRPMKASYW